MYKRQPKYCVPRNCAPHLRIESHFNEIHLQRERESLGTIIKCESEPIFGAETHLVLPGIVTPFLSANLRVPRGTRPNIKGYDHTQGKTVHNCSAYEVCGLVYMRRIGKTGLFKC